MKLSKYIALILVFFLSALLVTEPLLNQGIFQAHDLPSNLIYLGGFYSSLIEGNIIPRWAGNIANLYGYPIMFFYPLSYYLESLIKILGFSLIDTTKIYIFISFIFSSIFMFLWLRKHLPVLSAVLGALLYVYAPYRISDIYARGSIAENTFFMILPLFMYFLDKIRDRMSVKTLILFSLIFSLLILSHPFMLVIFAPLFFLYVIYLKFPFKHFKYLVFSFILSILMTAFYTIPLIFETKYTHYEISPFRGVDYNKHFLDFKKLIQPVWTFIDIHGNKEYQTYQIGLVQIFLFFISLTIFGFKSINKSLPTKTKKLFIISLFLLILSIFLMLPVSDIIYQLFPPLRQIVFPWRYLSLAIFSIALLTAISFSLISEKKQKLLLLMIIFSYLIFYLPYTKGHNYKIVDDDYYLYNVSITTDGFVALPKWAAQPDKYPRITDRYEIIDGDAVLTTLVRSSTKHIYNIEAKIDSRIADATFYYPGWRVYLDKKPIEIEFQDPAFRGIITFKVPKGNHLLEVIFTQTKLRRFADYLSLFTFLLIIFVYKNEKKIQKYLNRDTNI